MQMLIVKYFGLTSLRLKVLGIITVIILLSILNYFDLFKITKLEDLVFGRDAIELEDITLQSGLDVYSRPEINRDNPSYIEVMGGGVAVADVNGDGWEDLFFTGMPPLNSKEEENVSLSSMYLNQGDGKFKDVTVEAGLNEIKGFPMGALFFDFNNNGKQDLYVASYQGGQLFKNMGGYFTDITETSGVSLTGLCGDISCLAVAASAGDYNRDGFLDLLIVNNASWGIDNPAHYGPGSLTPAAYNGQPSVLFRNNGDGTFTNVSEETGVTNQDTTGYREDGKGLSAVWSDFNNDNWPDIYIANDLSPNRLYLNTGEGTFIETGKSGYVDEIKSSMGVDAADFNYSGYMDLVTTNLKGIMTSVFRNYGNIRFDYATFYTGIMPSARSSGWGVLFTDLDLDGYEDLIMAGGPIWNLMDETENIFFKNLGNGKFNDITSEVVNFPNNHISRGLAVIDADRSGTPDLIFSNIDGASPQLLKNKATRNNWLRIDLEGVVSNRDAVGARVTIEREDGLIQNQIVVAGNSYISSGSKSLYFGLGDSKVKELTILWPSGRTDTLENLDINQIIHIKEGSETDHPLTVTSLKSETSK